MITPKLDISVGHCEPVLFSRVTLCRHSDGRLLAVQVFNQLLFAVQMFNQSLVYAVTRRTGGSANDGSLWWSRARHVGFVVDKVSL